MFFGLIGKTRWPPWSLIGWDIFDFSFETAEQNSTKLDRKQDLNVLYQVCDFRADRKNKMAALVSDWLRHFLLLLWKPLNRIQRNLTGSKILTSSTQVCVFRADRKNKMASLVSDWLRHFRLLLWIRWADSMKPDRKQDLNVIYQVCVFRADLKNKMATLASDWLRHFRLLLWNHWTEFNETRQEARSQRPLPSLCFSGWSEKQDGCPGLWLAETYSTSPSETAERIQWNLTVSQDLNVLYQVFHADRKIKMAAPASD